MTSLTFTPGPSAPRPSPPVAGATAMEGRPRPRLGEALRAAKVFVGAAFRVAVLGEYAQEAGVKRR
ncbi:hypothetical protein [Streptomyces chryseus]|uniref:Uncharacterized protein n=1 Tax=Streptomyces chryseus TaxID=68186 RepID=A0ABQ3DSV1_9ACTN|nr:hypothetical protein [Streptomyces chryseus]GGX31656.1 hypothetical protein GCM10010353_53380 [Streptomyces chryseus]GHB14770.1 hypothetical protein GCM10010346_43070 [Streptomyces chryseus]